MNPTKEKVMEVVKLYELTRVDRQAGMYDICNGGIVAAKNETEARLLMSEAAWDEGSELWIDPKRSSCTILLHDSPRVIITDCNPG